METNVEKKKRSNPNSPITLINEIRKIKQLADKIGKDIVAKQQQLNSIEDVTEKFCVEQEITLLENKVKKLELRIQRKMERVKNLNKARDQKTDRFGSTSNDSQVGNKALKNE